jgi:hypothetical protein
MNLLIDGFSQQQPKGMGFKETIQLCLQNKQTNKQRLTVENGNLQQTCDRHKLRIANVGKEKTAAANKAALEQNAIIQE